MPQTSIVLSLPWEWAFPLMPLLLILVYYLYYVYLHPLAKYPGPFLAKVTFLRAAYHAWKGDMHLDSWRCHKVYGPVVRYGPNHLIFESPTAMREIYSLKANLNKSAEYGNSGKNQALNMVTILDKSEHAKRRKLAGPSFSSSNIKSFEPRLIFYIQRFLDALHAPPVGINSASSPSWSPAVDAADLCSYLTFDIMTDFLFGLQYNLLEDGQYRHVVHDIEDTHDRLFVMLHAPALYLGRLDKKLFPAAVRGAKGFLRFIDRLLKDHSHKSEKSQTIHLFSSFVEAKDGDGKPLLSQGNFIQRPFCSQLQDTTAVALRAILFYLTRFPHAYRNLAHEIRSTFAPNETISVDNKLKGCTYLNACLMESLRMSPVVGSIPYRRVQAGGATFDGSFIPEGYNVGSAVYTIHHNETLFPRPFEFIPERWLVDENTTQEQVNRRTQSWIPYLIGPRACIGKSFAQTVLLLTVASLLHKYDFRVADGPEGAKGSGYPLAEPGRTNPAEYQLRGYLVSTSVGPVIQLRPRS